MIRARTPGLSGTRTRIRCSIFASVRLAYSGVACARSPTRRSTARSCRARRRERRSMWASWSPSSASAPRSGRRWRRRCPRRRTVAPDTRHLAQRRARVTEGSSPARRPPRISNFASGVREVARHREQPVMLGRVEPTVPRQRRDEALDEFAPVRPRRPAGDEEPDGCVEEVGTRASRSTGRAPGEGWPRRTGDIDGCEARACRADVLKVAPARTGARHARWRRRPHRVPRRRRAPHPRPRPAATMHVLAAASRSIAGSASHRARLRPARRAATPTTFRAGPSRRRRAACQGRLLVAPSPPRPRSPRTPAS